MLLLCSTFDFVLEGLRSIETVEMGAEQLAIIVEKRRKEMTVTRDEKDEGKEKIGSSKQGREKQEYQTKCEILVHKYRSAVKIVSKITIKRTLFY
jgi:hypothetical protein